MKVVVVPAKEFTIAKQRLADALPATARAALARAMLEDVLAALAGAPVDRVVVITPDAEVAAVAERWGALVVRETEGHGHTAAVARGVALCREWGATVLLTCPGGPPVPHGRRGAPHPRGLRARPRGRLRPVPERARNQCGVPHAARRGPAALRRALVRRSSRGGARARHRAGGAAAARRGPRHRPPEDLQALRQAGPGTRAAADRSARRPTRPRRARRGSRCSGSAGSRSSGPGTISRASRWRRPPGKARRSRPATSSCSARRPSRRWRAAWCSSPTFCRPRWRSRSGTLTRRIPG